MQIMMIIWVGFVALNPLTVGASHRRYSIGDHRLARLQDLKPQRSFTPSRSVFGHLVALQAWQKISRTGVACPRPPPCVCHCDCPPTQPEKPPPPDPPCPVYPTFPTNPPPPKPPPPTTTAPPETTTTQTTTVDPNEVKCAEGEVMRADGTCSKIDLSVINEVKALVMEFKKELDKKEVEYAKAKEGHKLTWAYELQYEVLTAHNEYR